MLWPPQGDGEGVDVDIDRLIAGGKGSLKLVGRIVPPESLWKVRRARGKTCLYIGSWVLDCSVHELYKPK